jgi:hypothetical protein
VGKDHVVNSRSTPVIELRSYTKRKLLEPWHSASLKRTWDHTSFFCIKLTLHQTRESIRPNNDVPFQRVFF